MFISKLPCKHSESQQHKQTVRQHYPGTEMASPIALRIAPEPAGNGTPVSAASEVIVDQLQRRDGSAFGGRLTVMEGTVVTLTACAAALDLLSSCVVG